jgi:AcrR family transcriptional regulator
MPKHKSSALTPRKYASQERAGATVDAIVEASARILATDGAKALTTNRIARLAGVSIGSLYQYFPNKEAIVVAVIDAQLSRDKELLVATITSLRGGSSSDLTSAIRHIIATLCAHQHRVAPLLAEVLPLLSQLRQEQLVQQRFDEMCGLLEAFLAAHTHELWPHLHDPTRRGRTVRVLADALRGALNAAVRSPERLLTVSFQEDVCALALGALLSDERQKHA